MLKLFVNTAQFFLLITLLGTSLQQQCAHLHVKNNTLKCHLLKGLQSINQLQAFYYTDLYN